MIGQRQRMLLACVHSSAVIASNLASNDLLWHPMICAVEARTTMTSRVGGFGWGSGNLWLVRSLLVIVLAGCAGGGPPNLSNSKPVPSPPNPGSPGQPPPVPQEAGGVRISPQNAAAGPGQVVHFAASAAGGGAIAWSVNGVAGGNATVGTIDAKGDYVAPATVGQSENVVIKAALASAQQASYATAVVAVFRPGVVANTTNPQVAEYSMYLPQPGTLAVQFGPDTGYGISTWSQPTPSKPVNYGGEINMEVGGMRGSSTYHMQALITLANGVTFKDTDHTFTTGAAPPTVPLQITRPSGQTPQPGIELLDTIYLHGKGYSPNIAQAFATDLSGNVIWTYSYKTTQSDLLYPIKPLPNGHFLLLISFLASPNPQAEVPGTLNEIREIDLVGNVIHELTVTALNQSLAAKGFNVTLQNVHHDVVALPNGHLVLIGSMVKAYTNLPGYPGTINVLGDVLVDVDQNYNPDWVWNTFDHLNINRHPYLFPDWTHSNALLYSTDDHNLLLSIRHQNWIIKIDYQDATGSGNILWRLGEGGDFKLVGATDPTDWFYAQHGPNFFSPNTTGVFKLGVMDNGDDRKFPAGVTCGSTGSPPCLYSTVPELQVDESAKTATMLFHYIAPTNLYSWCCGQADLLANGDIEADFAAVPSGAVIREMDPTQTPPQIVWQAVTPNYAQYRALRIPSLYPGVQW